MRLMNAKTGNYAREAISWASTSQLRRSQINPPILYDHLFYRGPVRFTVHVNCLCDPVNIAAFTKFVTQDHLSAFCLPRVKRYDGNTGNSNELFGRSMGRSVGRRPGLLPTIVQRIRRMYRGFYKQLDWVVRQSLRTPPPPPFI